MSHSPRPLLISSFAAVLGLLLVTDIAAAQVRMSLRADMHLDGRDHGFLQAHPDQRMWPMTLNDFAAADLDGDGRLDLVAASNDGAGIVWRNAGDGSFLPPARVAGSFSGARCVAARDFDGDGDVDLFFGGGRTAYEGPGPCELWRNDGSGGFTRSHTLPLGQFQTIDIRDLCVGDFDGDGDVDMVLVVYTAAMQFWRNDGTGTFVDDTAVALPAGPHFNSDNRGAALDIDVDGDLDVLLRFPLTLLRNDGTGVLTPDPGWSLYGEPADLDGDGDTDLVGATQVHRNDGFGGFTAIGSIPAPPPAQPNDPLFTGSNGWSVVDVDGDGLLDLIGTPWSSRPTFLRNTGGFVFVDESASWFEPHALESRVVGYYWSASLAFDADGDGRPELVTGGVEGRNSFSTTVGVPPRMFVNADGQRLVHANRQALPMLQQTGGCIAGDVDGDGDVDLLFEFGGHYVASPTANLYLQDDAGRFGAAGTLPVGPSTGGLFDADGDGDLDLLALAGGGPLWPGQPGPHRLLQNDGNGQFVDVTATHLPSSAVSGGGAVAVGDVDGDGDLDLVIGSYDPVDWSGQGVPLMLLQNDGSGVFTDASAQLPSRPCQGGHLALADFDGDGDLDLAVASDVNHRLVDTAGTQILSTFYFRNDGAGQFVDETAARIPPVLAPGLIPVDLDGDGDLDLSVWRNDLINDGTGSFRAVPLAATDRIAIADFDENGLLETVTGGSGFGIVGTPVSMFMNHVEATRVLAVDLDRDGDLDLVALPQADFFTTDWQQLRIEVVYNLRRDLRVASLPRVGKPYRLHLRAGNGAPGAATPVLPALSIGRLPEPVTLPGLGALVLDPATTMLLPLSVVPDADTAAELAIPIPNDPQFLGLPLTCQALFGNGPLGQAATPSIATLSNAQTFAIEN
ncbi:MAG: FG-GAP repeat domain-containing protein [Planctomycetota bacterium]